MRLVPGIAAFCAAATFGMQFFLEWRESGGDLDARALVLAAVALASLLVAIASARLFRGASSTRDLKRSVALSVRELPFAGRGPGFVGLVWAAGLALAFLAHAGEGGLDGGDLVAWLCGASLIALCAAIVAWFAVRALPALAARLATRFAGVSAPAHRIAGIARAVARIERRDAWPPKLFNRPPPLLQA
ncbi:MAG TPA: hypothetical protein VIG46_02435 [Candidatus Baltobacteraceae bacterium]|jgi:hypothetical protein